MFDDSGVRAEAPALPADRLPFVYRWPGRGALEGPAWTPVDDGRLLARTMPETDAELARDSRWPALFPSAICLVTVSDGEKTVLEKVVGASIDNRFPYTMALSFCRRALSDRHYVRSATMDLIESSGRVAVQFLRPGPELEQAMAAINGIPEEAMAERLLRAGKFKRTGRTSGAPILNAAYLVYEGRLVRPGRDFEGEAVNAQPFIDCGSHRIYNFEIEAISLATEIASGRSPVQWRSLPVWRGAPAPGPVERADADRDEQLSRVGYLKSYRPDYVFPSPETIAFEGTPTGDGFSELLIEPFVQSQAEVDNDRARWPCFFPSSLGLITSVSPDGRRAAFACGSTSVVSRQPFTIGVCVSYARINARYAPRASLDVLRAAGRFTCGVPIHRQDVLDAIAYLGNISLRDDQTKADNAGLTPMSLGAGFGYRELPIHFECRIVDDVRLGTHAMLLGQVERIVVDARLRGSALEWCPWAGLVAPSAAAGR